MGLLVGCGGFESTSTGTETGTETTTGSDTDPTTDTGTDPTTNTTSDTDPTTSSTSDTTPTTTPPNPCFGDPKEETTNEDCVVFVQADAPSAPGEGTREKPFTSLQDGIDAAIAGNKRVFACKSERFVESVVLTAPVEVWGGFDCTDGVWAYDPSARTELEALPDTIAMTLQSEAGGSLIVGWYIEAPDGISPGWSPIAVAIDEVTLQTSFWRTDLFAGNGADGADGEPWITVAKAGVDAPLPGQPGGATDACAASVKGGDGAVMSCGDGISTGGNGGVGGPAPAGNGTDGVTGQPAPPADYYGEGGKGQAASACTNGNPGIHGITGDPGAGGISAGVMTLKGLVTGAGAAGGPGLRGQGGGGGGGAKAGQFCGGNTGAGASGGGGGAGGCGGKGGKPGLGGGSSIGLIMFGGPVYFQDMTITTSLGGNGGDGSAGQLGGKGGKGAPGGAKSPTGGIDGCAGGNGGDGWPGGIGGGGRGGDSVCIGYIVDTPTYDNYDCFYGTRGDGGNSAPNLPQETEGTSGQAGLRRSYKPQPGSP
ncbi:MAG: hypothetical protein R3B70_31645 [Polyangiaceae bacterium]